MNAGKTLLKRKFQNVSELQRSQMCMFDNKSGEFVLVLNCYGFLCQKRTAKLNWLTLMAAVVWKCSIHTWKLLVPNVSGCTGGSDCGLLVLGVTNHWTGLLDGTLDWTGLTFIFGFYTF